MKSWFACAIVSAMLLGCKGKDEPGEIIPPKPELKKEDVMPYFTKSIYRIDQWYGVTGKDTTFLKNDPVYGEIMKRVFLIFREDRVYYYMGYEFPNTDFLGNARTFNVDMYYVWPMDMTYQWDDKEDNLLMPWQNRNDNLHIMPQGITMRFDKHTYKQVKTFGEAKATRTSATMRFQYEHQGKTFTMLLKQMWVYGESGPKRNLYVAF